MKNKLIRTTILFMAIFTFSFVPFTATAQDTGPIAMKNLTFYSLIGGGAGVLLGAALWALDPLGPSSDISQSAYTGLGLGVLIGTIWGITVMQEQAIIPFNADQPPPEESEFDGDFGLKSTVPKLNGRNEIPLLGMEYRF